MSDKPQLPTSLPGGDLLPFMSAKRRNQICDTVFEMLGGVERLHDEADKNPVWFYEKLWSKGLPRVGGTEVSVSEGVETLLEQLDKAEAAKTIEGIFEVKNAP